MKKVTWEASAVFLLIMWAMIMRYPELKMRRDSSKIEILIVLFKSLSNWKTKFGIPLLSDIFSFVQLVFDSSWSSFDSSCYSRFSYKAIYKVKDIDYNLRLENKQ